MPQRHLDLCLALVAHHRARVPPREVLPQGGDLLLREGSRVLVGATVNEEIKIIIISNDLDHIQDLDQDLDHLSILDH